MRNTTATIILGLTLLCGVRQAAASIVNGGFETGDFTGWTIDPTPSFEQYIVTNNILNPQDLGPVNSGEFAAQIAGYSDVGDGPNTLSQVVTTIAGQLYDLSFARYQAIGGPTVSLEVTWNGDTVFSELNPIIRGIYQTFSVSVVGTGSDELVFISAHDPAYTYLDDVTLVAVDAVPEPASLALWGLGALGCAVAGYRRRKSA